MEFVYEHCGHCGRKGAYVVPGRGVVRCKYCSMWTATAAAPEPGLAAAARRLKARLTLAEGWPEDDPEPEPDPAGQAASAGTPRGVWRMDRGALALLADAAVGRAPRPPLALARTTDARTEGPAPAAPGQPPRVFVVDDDEQVRTLIAMTLRNAGFAVSEAGDGAEACRAMVADPPDAAVLDLTLPGMDGLALLVELRRRCDTGVIVLSGRAEEGDRVVGLELGADDYLGKPFSRDELVARVRSVLRRRAAATAAAPAAPVA